MFALFVCAPTASQNHLPMHFALGVSSGPILHVRLGLTVNSCRQNTVIKYSRGQSCSLCASAVLFSLCECSHQATAALLCPLLLPPCSAKHIPLFQNMPALHICEASAHFSLAVTHLR